MSLSSIDIQATYQIINIFENSKFHADSILDTIPHFFAVINEDGRILRGNEEVAKLLGVDLEGLIYKNIHEIFTEENWNLFKSKLVYLKEAANGKIEFQLAIGPEKTKQKSYLWNVSQLQGLKSNLSRCYSLTGKDISELEKMLTELLTAQKDIEVTAEIQNLLLPKKRHFQTPQFQMLYSYQPATKSGGDWIWHHHREQGKKEESALFLLGDVTGHGIGPAMITAIISGGCHTFAQLYAKKKLDLIKLFSTLADSLETLSENKYWMTLAALELFPKKREFRWLSAGAPPLLRLEKNGHMDLILIPGTPLGAPSPFLKEKYGKYAPGDRFFIYSDGVPELLTPDHALRQGSRMLREFLEQEKNETLEITMQKLEKLLDQARKSTPNPDDASIIMIEAT